MFFVYLFVSALLTSLISGVIGMAGGSILLVLLAFILNPMEIIPLHGVTQLSSNFTRAYILRDKINRPKLMFFGSGAILGGILSSFVIQQFSSPKFFYLGIFAVIMMMLFKPKKLKIHLKDRSFSILGLIIGALAPFTGATGPMIAPFIFDSEGEKEKVVATKAAFQCVTHVMKIPIFISLSFRYQDYLPHMALLVCATIMGTKIGTNLLKKTSNQVFNKLFKVLLFGAGIKLLFKFSTI
tara:strand:+ start:200 stop:919 length:720 start_codon:yes stop_codon:yes gene_type:complete